jgi:hypothetical protein
VARIGENLVDVTHLDDLAEIHHRDPIRDMAYDRQVMGYEKERQAHALTNVLEQVQHLRTDRDIKGRDRLVADDEPRLGRERAGNADALPLPAREFMRKPSAEFRAQAHLLQKLGNARGPLDPAHPGGLLERHLDDLVDGLARIERGERILEDHLELSPERTQVPVRHPGDVDPVEEKRTATRLDQAHDRLAERRFSASGLADQPDNLTGMNMQVHAVNDLQRSIVDADVLELQERLRRRTMHSLLP